MRLSFTRDYRDRTGTRGRMNTGIYQNIGERVSFRYIEFQVRGIGRLSLSWSVRGWAE